MFKGKTWFILCIIKLGFIMIVTPYHLRSLTFSHHNFNSFIFLMLSQCRNNFEEACVAKWKKQELSWLLVNINELIENLVSEVRHSFEISLPSWPFVGPASLFRLAYWGVCYCEPCFSSFMCADRRLTLVYYQECLGILIIYWISTRQKK